MVGQRVIGLVAMICIGLGGYCIKALLSGGRDYGELSLDYWLLTPSVIKAVGSECTGKALFSYRAADGSKPMVSKVDCNIQPENFMQIALEHGFSENGYASFKKESFELELHIGNGEISVVTLIEYQ